MKTTTKYRIISSLLQSTLILLFIIFVLPMCIFYLFDWCYMKYFSFIKNQHLYFQKKFNVGYYYNNKTKKTILLENETDETK